MGNSAKDFRRLLSVSLPLCLWRFEPNGKTERKTSKELQKRWCVHWLLLRVGHNSFAANISHNANRKNLHAIDFYVLSPQCTLNSSANYSSDSIYHFRVWRIFANFHYDFYRIYFTFFSVLWLAFICVALFSIISLSKRTWHRFQTSPMVISMDRNKLVWNTSFPSLTVCPHKRIDELKVEEYILWVKNSVS